MRGARAYNEAEKGAKEIYVKNGLSVKIVRFFGNLLITDSKTIDKKRLDAAELS